MYPEHITYPDNLPLRAFVCNVRHIPYHWHDAVEIIYVLAGSLQIHLSDETHLLSKTMIATANANEIHKMRQIGEVENRVLVVQIDRSWCEQVLPDFPFTFFWCCSTYQDTTEPDSKYLQLRRYLHALVRTLLQPPQDHLTGIRELVRELLSFLSSDFDFIRLGSGLDDPRDKQVIRIKQMYEYVVERNYQVSLSELAREFNLSLYHMSHTLSDRFGLNFQALLNYSKGEEAARLLLGTNMRITDISHECGFSDQKYLVKYFHEHYHCTPTQFRKAYRVDQHAIPEAFRYQTYPLVCYDTLLREMEEPVGYS
jgi:AraC-like DNA-binding protein